MPETQTTPLQRHMDRVRQTKAGEILLVCEPIVVFSVGFPSVHREGLALPVGSKIKFCAASRHFLIGVVSALGITLNVKIAPDDWHRLEGPWRPSGTSNERPHYQR